MSSVRLHSRKPFVYQLIHLSVALTPTVGYHNLTMVTTVVVSRMCTYP